MTNQEIIEQYTTIDWDGISYIKNLPEDFIREYKDNFNWALLSKNQTLSEDIIREFKDDRKARYWILRCQALSESLIREFVKLENWDDARGENWNTISFNQTLSDEFREEFKDRL